MICADCGNTLDDTAARWELEDGRTVCHACCVEDTRRFAELLTGLHADERFGNSE